MVFANSSDYFSVNLFLKHIRRAPRLFYNTCLDLQSVQMACKLTEKYKGVNVTSSVALSSMLHRNIRVFTKNISIIKISDRKAKNDLFTVLMGYG